MPKIFKTAKNKNQHDHFLYLTDIGHGISSTTKDHSHYVQKMQPQMPMGTDFGLMPPEGMGGTPQMEPQWQIEPGIDGHTHQVGEEYRPKEDEKQTLEDNKLVDLVITLYREAKDREKDSRKNGHAAESVRDHDQWPRGLKERLESEDRAAVTINKVEAKIDVLCGYQKQNRTDFHFFPTENGDQRVADILNVVVKNITDQCDYCREESKVFEDATTPGRGLFNVFPDFTRNVAGNIVIESFPWDDCYIGPHEKEDLSDCDYLVKSKWYTLAKLKEMHPDKFKELSPENKEKEGTGERSEDWDKSGGMTTTGGAGNEDLVDVSKKNYRMLELWKKEFSRNFIIINHEDGFIQSGDGWTASDIAQIKTVPGFHAIPRVTYRLRVTRVISNVLLEDEYPDLPVNDFQIVPLYGKFRRGEFYGKVRGVIDLQLLVNKSYSQFVDILNKVTNYGWFYDANTFPSPKEENQWKHKASSPGFNIKLENVEKPPHRVEGSQFPKELVSAMAQFSMDIREVMNINLDLQGGDQNQQSGVAMRQKILQQLIGNDFLFDNLSFAKKKLGKLIVGWIKKLYPPERILRILNNQNIKEKTQNGPSGGGVQIGGQPLEQYQPEEIAVMIANNDLMEYDIVVSESASSPSAMMGNFLILMDMASKGIQIPPMAILEFAPIPNKEKIQAQIQQAMEQQAAENKMKYDTEIQKATIAQQGKMLDKNPAQGGGPMSGGMP